MLETIFTILMVMFWYVCGVASTLLFLILFRYKEFRQLGVSLDIIDITLILLVGLFGPSIGVIFIVTFIFSTIILAVSEGLLKVEYKNNLCRILTKGIVRIRFNKGKTANHTTVTD